MIVSQNDLIRENVTAEGCAPKQEICIQLEYHLSKQQILCRSLERLADSLPRRLDPQICLQLSRDIMPIVNMAHKFEEQLLFPELLKTSTHVEKLEQTLERLRYEHWEDESFGEEISEGLREYGMGRPYSVDKLSYMLRGFFESLRRHIAFDAEILLPLLKSETPSYGLVQ